MNKLLAVCGVLHRWLDSRRRQLVRLGDGNIGWIGFGIGMVGFVDSRIPFLNQPADAPPPPEDDDASSSLQ